MQHNTKVDVKVGCDLIFTSSGCCRVRGYRVCHESKTEFWNAANITREDVRNPTDFTGDLELTLPSIVYRNYTICKLKIKETAHSKAIHTSFRCAKGCLTCCRRKRCRPARESWTCRSKYFVLLHALGSRF
jgi:hypothetical protein